MPYPGKNVTTSMQRAILLIAVISSFITPFDGSAVNIALPTIGEEFSLDAVTLSWITTAYLLSIAILLVPFGKLADMKGRKRIFLVGITIFTAASFLVAFSADAGTLIGLRLLQGTGCAMIFGTSLAILSAAYPPKERGKALGITIAAVYVGLSAGPFLGGLMTETLGWRSIFLVNVPLGILCILFTVWKLPLEWKNDSGEHFDLAGSFLWAIALIFVMYGLSILPGLPGIGLIFSGIVALVAFGLLELRVPAPVLNMKLFLENRVFAFSNFAALINYSATYAVTFLLSLYLQIAKDFSAEYAGLILVAQPAMQALFSPMAGKLSDRLDPGTVASFGMAVTVVGLFFLTFLDSDSTLPFILGCLLFLGIGFGIFSSPNTNAIFGSVNRDTYGVASGMVGTMRLLGQMLSMGLAMTIFAIMIGNDLQIDENVPLFIESIHVAFLLFFLLCIFGLAFSLVRRKRPGFLQGNNR
ncbi:MAG: putative transporter [Methanoregulaceae archaeon PtaB.Bin009]|nr:MAG: putative transporter [Methanoregulaceae archaeon PtaB.Bin009]